MTVVKRIALGVVVMITMLLFSGIVVLNNAASPAKAAGAAIVNVKFDESSVVADVSPGSDAIVHLTGTVSCQVPVDANVQSVQVSLQPECAWPAGVAPSSMTFTSQNMNQPQSFDVSVLCPPLESMKSNQPIQLGGDWRNFPGLTGGSITGKGIATIKVEQYFKFSVQCAKPFVEVGPGTPVTYNVKINNEGNGQDTFSLSTGKIPKGWTVQLGTTAINIDERKSQTVSVTITPPQEWNVWKNHVTMIKIAMSSKVAYMRSRLLLEEEYPIFMRERGASSPGFEPMITALALVCALGIAAGRMTFDQRKRTRR